MFVDFPIFNEYFQHELNFSWKDQQQQLIDQGHDPNSADNKPLQLPQSGSSSAAGKSCAHDILGAASYPAQTIENAIDQPYTTRCPSIKLVPGGSVAKALSLSLPAL